MKKNKKEKSLQELLEVNNIKIVSNFTEIEKLFDLNDLDDEGTPKIICDKKTLIIFDNSLFNETYLIDVFNDFMEQNPHFFGEKELDILYVDNLEIKLKLMSPQFFLEGNEVPTDYDSISELEKELVPPTLLTINPEKDFICLFPEPKHVIFKVENIKSILTWLQ